ncbi:MAG: hypothetical protein PHI59_02070 [Candidatus Omnitrophica bacterium]|nr:hypothetical protein [Candidatus Omnitrophota bacterium]
MTNTPKTKVKLSNAFKDFVIILIAIIIVFILSYHFNVFAFLMELFKKDPWTITLVDEIITGLLTLSIGLAIFAWRRFLELKKETAERMKLQEELLIMAKTTAEATKIVNKELRSEIEYHRNKNK